MFINNYTGEIYTGIWNTVKTVILDMVRFPKCRTIKMLIISRFTE